MTTNNTNNNTNDKKKTKPEEELYYCEKELRALGKSLECCVCIRLMESPSRTRWYYVLYLHSSFWKFPLPILIPSSSHSAHYFCKKCILDCAKANGKCPLCKSDVNRREVKPDAMMTEMIELYKKLVVKVVKEEDKEEEEEKKRRSVPYMSQLPMTQNT